MRTAPHRSMFHLLLLGVVTLWGGVIGTSAQETTPNPVLATYAGKTLTRDDYNLYLRANRGEITQKRPTWPDHPEILEDFAILRITSASLEKEVTHEAVLQKLHWEIWALECKEAYTRLTESVFRSDTTPTLEEMELYYKDHLVELTPPQDFSFRNIFFDLSRCPDDRCRSEIEHSANETLSILKARIEPASGAIPLSSFLEVATRQTGKATPEFKVRGPFPLGEINPELEHTAMSLQPGQISGLLKTRMGLQIIRLESKSTGEPPTFEQVRESIRQQIQISRINQRRRDFYTTHLNPDKMEITTEGLNELVHWATSPNEVKDVLLAKAGTFSLNVRDYLSYLTENNRDLLPDQEQSSEEIRQTHIDNLKSTILEPERFRQSAEELGLTQDATYTHRIQVDREILLGRCYLQSLLLVRYTTLAPISGNEIEQYYQQHSTEFQSGAQYRLREIAIKPQEATAPVEIEMAMRDAEKRALEAVETIRKGANEKETIQKLSNGEEAALGGVTGWMPRDTRYSQLVWNDLVRLPRGRLDHTSLSSPWPGHRAQDGGGKSLPTPHLGTGPG